MELLLRIIVPNISTEYFSGIFQEKTFKKNVLKVVNFVHLLRKCFHFLMIFLTAPSCFNKQKKCRYERTFKERIVLLKYQYFRFRTKSGAHFELLNWIGEKVFDAR